MPKIARVGDRHEGSCGHGADCCPHEVSGVFVSGSPNVTANGKAVVRVGDALTHNCPHCGTGEALTGSSSVKANGIAVHRIGDAVIYPGGSGVTVSGSPDIEVGD